MLRKLGFMERLRDSTAFSPAAYHLDSKLYTRTQNNVVYVVFTSQNPKKTTFSVSTPSLTTPAMDLPPAMTPPAVAFSVSSQTNVPQLRATSQLKGEMTGSSLQLLSPIKQFCSWISLCFGLPVGATFEF